MDEDNSKMRGRANGITFPAAEPKYRAARQRCAEACANYNGQAEFASPEQRARLWQAIVSPQATEPALDRAVLQNESEIEQQPTGRKANGVTLTLSDSTDSEATKVPLAAGLSAAEPCASHSPDDSQASQPFQDSASTEARPAVSRVTPPPSPDFKDIPPSTPITDGHPVSDYVVAPTPPPSRKASQPELDMKRDSSSASDEEEHDPAVTNPFIVNAPYVKPPVHIDYGINLHIGANTFINRNFVVIDSPVCHIRIGERCQFGPNVILAAVEHPLGEYSEFLAESFQAAACDKVVASVRSVSLGIVSVPSYQHDANESDFADADARKSPIGSPSIASNIEIGDECWIAAGAKILCGVRIGSGCVIGAGSVVTKDIPDGCMAFGNPARVIRVVSPRHYAKSLSSANPGEIIDSTQSKWRADVPENANESLPIRPCAGKAAAAPTAIQMGKDLALLLLGVITLARLIVGWL